MSDTLLRRARLLPLALAAALAACKGGSAGGAAASASGTQNAVGGGSSAPGGSGAGERTDRAPALTYFEDSALRVEREFRSLGYDGEVRRFHERAQSDGAGRLRVDLLAVWNPASGTWIAPHPLIEALYGPRSFYLIRHRDLHLGHQVGLYGNYVWEAQPGTVTLAGRVCQKTVARSLHGYGPIELVHEQGTGLLLGWTVYAEDGTTAVAQLETTLIEPLPATPSVDWIADRVPEQPYSSEAHDALLGFTPYAPSAPPAGFYRAEARVVDGSGLFSTVTWLYVERWSDGLRSLFLVQHRLHAPPIQDTDIQLARRSQEGGLVVVETDLADRRLFGISLLPVAEVEMAVASLLPE